LRQLAVTQGRAMIRVRHRETRDPATIGVCPACFNLHTRREALLRQLEKMGYEVAYREDRLDGAYREGRQHAPGCRYGHLASDPWDRFRTALKRRKFTGRSGR